MTLHPCSFKSALWTVSLPQVSDEIQNTELTYKKKKLECFLCTPPFSFTLHFNLWSLCMLTHRIKTWTGPQAGFVISCSICPPPSAWNAALSFFFFFKNVLVLAMIFSRFKWLMIWNIQTLANCDTVNAFQKLRVNKSNEMTCWSSCFNLKISLLSLCTTMTFRIARRLARQTKSPVVTCKEETGTLLGTPKWSGTFSNKQYYYYIISRIMVYMNKTILSKNSLRPSWSCPAWT